MREYSKWNSGEPYKIKVKERLYVACCDCDLVHRMKFEPDGKYITITVWRSEGETKKLRKRKKA